MGPCYSSHGEGGLRSFPLNLGSLMRLYDFQGDVMQGHTAPAWFFQPLSQSPELHLRSTGALKPPCCEEAQTSTCGETTWRGPETVKRDVQPARSCSIPLLFQLQPLSDSEAELLNQALPKFLIPRNNEQG